MSYSNPDILILSNPIGIDAVVQTVQQHLYAGLPWLTKSFGRAWEFKEKTKDGKFLRIPKVYVGAGEYLNVLPNDFITAQSFIAVRDAEDWGDPEEYSSQANNNLQRRLSILFWFNLKSINPAKDFVFTEELKKDVQQILKTVPYIGSIDGYVDERAENIFDTYDLVSVSYSVDDASTQYLMYPYGGFRFDVTVKYPEYADCLPIPFDGLAATQQLFDIEFTTDAPGAPAAGSATYTNATLIGRKIRVFRMGLRSYGDYWSFDSTTGTVTFAPVLGAAEEVAIEAYGYGNI